MTTAKNRAYYLANRETLLAKAKAWREANPEKARAYHQRHQGSEKAKDTKLRRTFGISLADYVLMLAAQGGVCAICKRPETRKRRAYLAVDHDHETGRVRGLLCSACNAGMGHFDDSPRLLVAAAQYLEGASWAALVADEPETELALWTEDS